MVSYFLLTPLATAAQSATARFFLVHRKLHHMPASRKKLATDRTALMVDFESYPFNAERFFTDLRTMGAAPSVYRRGGETSYSFFAVDSKLTQRVFEISHRHRCVRAWS